MKNSLYDLNNYLFESIERLLDDSLSDAELKREISRAKAVKDVSREIVRNASLMLKASEVIGDQDLSTAGILIGGGDDGKKALSKGS